MPGLRSFFLEPQFGGLGDLLDKKVPYTLKRQLSC
jgi:hypothetical protein